MASERPGDNPSIPPEAYEARKVMVHDKRSNKLVEKMDIMPDGYYSVGLKLGIYIVDRSGDFPKEVEIKAGERVEVNIDIDTGIR